MPKRPSGKKPSFKGTSHGKRIRALRAARDMHIRAGDAAGRTGLANTVVYIHGIDNKPKEETLRCMWDRALFGNPMGDRTRMAYWVFRDRYPTPLAATCANPDAIVGATSETPQPLTLASLRDPFADTLQIEPPAIKGLAHEIPASADAAQLLRELDAALVKNRQVAAAATKQITGGPKAAGWTDDLLGGASNWIFERTHKLLLKDVHDFFFDADRRRIMVDCLLARLSTGGGPFVVVGHSQGSMIAYDVLRGLDPAEYNIPLFVTIGSPLGLPPVRDQFRKWAGVKSLPFPHCVKRWVNVANLFDIVCADRNLNDDIDKKSMASGQSFENVKINGPNKELRWDRHSATGYLRTDEVRREVTKVVGAGFAERVALRVIASDAVEHADTRPDDGTPVLIELFQERGRTERDLGQLADGIVAKLKEFSGKNESELKIDKLKRFVSARVDRTTLEKLRTEYRDLNIYRVWMNSKKKTLVNVSAGIIHVTAANRAYQAEGQGVTWAVLDTGIDQSHPHFSIHQNVISVRDCTRIGQPPIELTADADRNGHGTHVAGIIAGEFAAGDARMAGMAPRAKLVGYKVLTDNGEGEDAFIIKALDHVALVNENAGELAIHGVNLSLGGDFNPEVFACGHSPLCNELRRLWRQGVLVVIAAGNEGYDTLRTVSGSRQANLDLTISDPANLEEAIAVGSVHRSKPHNYGISFFSSRGPTADGRFKPDVVAPGEKILSAKAGKPLPGVHGIMARYEALSGTSMAAPHVSGLLAAFLSVRREFIGWPDKVKHLLMSTCTDLKRDRYFQGAGMPNLVKMLAAT